MDDASWAALTLTLTVAGGIWTWLAFRRRGLASGLRALGFTLLPPAAYLTKTLQMFTGIAGEIGAWAGNLVWNPMVWSGIVVGAVGIGLIVMSGALRSRQVARSVGPPAAGPGELPARRTATRTAETGQPALAGDDDMAEIEAILRKRGIS
ncbi:MULTISPECIES: hypothetical protein [unclassified Nocardioides]|uniref:hypothetical protein n=1 Tax=unclassified Nocardioides TaxID=2615069 RepID=UPI0009F10E59|nr:MULTISPECIES: hypothetical protein [unclassified Nocardioides]GAW49526.1 uncharacterized protein PD653B2_1852 [Nocardioides sp. PD653-B2]GAW54960.1 uncharacterized protein PD653_2375 [Nocardioides sp. PD653]